jgi:hypothetical protein
MTTEKQDELKRWVSGAQWSVSGIVVCAIMLLITGTDVPDWLSTLGTGYVVTVGPAAMIVGMYLIWIEPGWNWRKLIVVGVEVYIIFAGIGLFHFTVDRAKADEGNALRGSFLAGAEYKTAKDSYEGAKAEWEAQAARIRSIPGDFTTGARQTTAASEKARADFDKASATLIAIEAKAPKAPEPVSAAGVFRIFGKENEGWVLAVILGILGISYEAVALAMSWRPGSVPKPVRDKPTEAPRSVPVVPPVKLPKQFTPEEYYKAARQGRTDGKVSGRETVMNILGIPEREARRLYGECVKLGYIIQRPNQDRDQEKTQSSLA